MKNLITIISLLITGVNFCICVTYVCTMNKASTLIYQSDSLTYELAYIQGQTSTIKVIIKGLQNGNLKKPCFPALDSCLRKDKTNYFNRYNHSNGRH